jgi:hypothetical protein
MTTKQIQVTDAELGSRRSNSREAGWKAAQRDFAVDPTTRDADEGPCPPDAKSIPKTRKYVGRSPR